MSNNSSNKEQNRLIELSDTQLNPGAAKPSDFEVLESSDPRPKLPLHGQCGSSQAEYDRLLNEGNRQVASIPDRVEPSDAKKPNTKLLVSPGNK